MKKIIYFIFILLTNCFTIASLLSCGDDVPQSHEDEEGEKKDSVPVVKINDEFVDLGLPSGTLWAKCNIGALKPEEYGDYFRWGMTYRNDTTNYLSIGDYEWGGFSYGNTYEIFKYISHCYDDYIEIYDKSVLDE